MHHFGWDQGGGIRGEIIDTTLSYLAMTNNCHVERRDHNPTAGYHFEQQKHPAHNSTVERE